MHSPLHFMFGLGCCPSEGCHIVPEARVFPWQLRLVPEPHSLLCPSNTAARAARCSLSTRDASGSLCGEDEEDRKSMLHVAVQLPFTPFTKSQCWSTVKSERWRVLPGHVVCHMYRDRVGRCLLCLAGNGALSVRCCPEAIAVACQAGSSYI